MCGFTVWGWVNALRTNRFAAVCTISCVPGCLDARDKNSAVGRVYFARVPGGEWIDCYDLPAKTTDALRQRMVSEEQFRGFLFGR